MSDFDLLLSGASTPAELMEKGGFPVGTIRERKDGKYQKQEGGKWARVSGPDGAPSQDEEGDDDNPYLDEDGYPSYDDSEESRIRLRADAFSLMYSESIKTSDWGMAAIARKELKALQADNPDAVLSNGRTIAHELRNLDSRRSKKRARDRRKPAPDPMPPLPPPPPIMPGMPIPTPPEPPEDPEETPQAAAERLASAYEDAIMNGTESDAMDARQEYVDHMRANPDIVLENGRTMKHQLRNLDSRRSKRKARRKGRPEPQPPEPPAPPPMPIFGGPVGEPPPPPPPVLPGGDETDGEAGGEAGGDSGSSSDPHEMFKVDPDYKTSMYRQHKWKEGFQEAFDNAKPRTYSDRDDFPKPKDVNADTEIARYCPRGHSIMDWVQAKRAQPEEISTESWKEFCQANMYAVRINMPPVPFDAWHESYKRERRLLRGIRTTEAARGVMAEHGFDLGSSVDASSAKTLAFELARMSEAGLNNSPVRAGRGGITLDIKRKIGRNERVAGTYYPDRHHIDVKAMSSKSEAFIHELWHAADADLGGEQNSYRRRDTYATEGEVLSEGAEQIRAFTLWLKGTDIVKGQVEGYRSSGDRKYASYHNEPVEIFARFGEQLMAYRSMQAVAEGRMVSPTTLAKGYSTYTSKTQRYFSDEEFQKILAAWESMPAGKAFEASLAKALGLQWWLDVLGSNEPGGRVVYSVNAAVKKSGFTVLVGGVPLEALQKADGWEPPGGTHPKSWRKKQGDGYIYKQDGPDGDASASPQEPDTGAGDPSTQVAAHAEANSGQARQELETGQAGQVVDKVLETPGQMAEHVRPDKREEAAVATVGYTGSKLGGVLGKVYGAIQGAGFGSFLAAALGVATGGVSLAIAALGTFMGYKIGGFLGKVAGAGFDEEAARTQGPVAQEPAPEGYRESLEGKPPPEAAPPESHPGKAQFGITPDRADEHASQLFRHYLGTDDLGELDENDQPYIDAINGVLDEAQRYEDAGDPIPDEDILNELDAKMAAVKNAPQPEPTQAQGDDLEFGEPEFVRSMGRFLAHWKLRKAISPIAARQDPGKALKQRVVDMVFNIKPEDLAVLKEFIKPDGTVDEEGIKHHFEEELRTHRGHYEGGEDQPEEGQPDPEGSMSEQVSKAMGLSGNQIYKEKYRGLREEWGIPHPEDLEDTSKANYIPPPKNVLEVKCTGDAGKMLVALLLQLKKLGEDGASREVVVSPEDKDYKMRFGFDGDGADYVQEIKLDGKIQKGEPSIKFNDMVTLTIQCTREAAASLAPLLLHLKYLGDCGASRDIIVSPDDKSLKASHGFDGDGADQIERISINGREVKRKEKTDRWEAPVKELDEFWKSHDADLNEADEDDTVAGMTDEEFVRWFYMDGGSKTAETLARQQGLGAYRERGEEAGVEKARKLAGRCNIRGFDISIEQDKGDVREGTGPGGKKWRTLMRSPYGYIRLTQGVDGDHFDVWLGPEAQKERRGGKGKWDTVYVMHMKDRRTGKYDEDKAGFGYKSASEFVDDVMRHYDEPEKHVGPVSEFGLEKFRELVYSTKKNPKKLDNETFGKATRIGPDKYQSKEGGTGYFREVDGSPHFFLGDTPGEGQLAGGRIHYHTQGKKQGGSEGGEGGSEGGGGLQGKPKETIPSGANVDEILKAGEQALSGMDSEHPERDRLSSLLQLGRTVNSVDSEELRAAVNDAISDSPVKPMQVDDSSEMDKAPDKAEFTGREDVKLLGKGAFGEVYSDPGPPPTANKFGAVTHGDLNYGRIADKLGIGPKVHSGVSTGMFGRDGFMSMEMLEGDNIGDFFLNQGLIVKRGFSYGPPDDLSDEKRALGVKAMAGDLRNMAALHKAGYAHNDSHSQNNVVDSQGNIKLIDYGMASEGYPSALREVAFNTTYAEKFDSLAAFHPELGAELKKNRQDAQERAQMSSLDFDEAVSKMMVDDYYAKMDEIFEKHGV